MSNSTTTATTVHTDTATVTDGATGRTSTATEHTEAPSTRPRRVWRVGVVSGVVAAAANTLIVLAARAADIDLAVDGEEIPLVGFAELTMVGALIGIALAKAYSRWARHPRKLFVITTVVLTVLSLVPDLAVDATTGSKLVLALTHVVAAAIIIPAIATRLRS